MRSRCHAVRPWTISASACPSLTPSGSGKLSPSATSACSAYPPLIANAATRVPSGSVPTTSLPGTSGSVVRDR